MKTKHLCQALLLTALTGSALAQSPPGKIIAGLTPAERPANAPRIAAVLPPDKTQALHGVTEPTPPSLKFLEHQGAWFTPFTHPGMTPPYDLRGWHAKPAPTAK